MAGSTGLEPATSGLTVQCANQAAPRARGHLPYTGRRRFVHPAAIDDADSSERPAAAPARSTAGRAARGEAAPASAAVAVATPGREDRLLRPLRERAEIVGEARQREVAATLVPGRRGDLDALEVEDPALGDAERDRPRQPPVQRVGRQPLEAVLLGPLEELLEAPHLREHPHARQGLARHHPTPADKDEPARDDPNTEPRGGAREPGGCKHRQEESGGGRDRARQHPSGSDASRRGGEEAVLHHQAIELIADRREHVLVVAPYL